jgi:hypothetical protein
MKKMDHSFAKAFLISISMLFAAGCGRTYQVGVTSISSDAAMAKKNYVLLPAAEGADAYGVEFKEYAGYVHRALRGKGFNQASREAADVVVFLSYGIGEPTTEEYTLSHPSATRTVARSRSGGRYAHVGGDTTYSRYLIIDAYEAGKFRESEGKDLAAVWKTAVTSRGTRSDLGQVFPVMVAGAYEYIGRDTKQKVHITLSEGDERVKFIKGTE